jgi:predicted Zn-dependent protease with MMP-like domain
MPPEDFEELVSDALDGIPEELAQLMANVVVLVEDDPDPSDPHLLGLYEGIPLTERGEWYSGVLPDRITIYRNPLLELCDTPEELIEEVRTTVVHEVAHHFGIEDDRLDELGY